MKWNKLVILSSVVLGMLAVSTARAQGHMHGAAPGMGGHVAPGMVGQGFHGHDFGHHHFHHHFNDFVFFDFGFPFYPYPFYYPYSFYYPYPYYSYDPYGYYGAPGYQGYGGYQRYGGGSSVVIEVQRRLVAGGYYHGAIDGVIGSGTRRAIRTYECSHGLPVDDGVLSRRFLAMLGLAKLLRAA